MLIYNVLGEWSMANVGLKNLPQPNANPQNAHPRRVLRIIAYVEE